MKNILFGLILTAAFLSVSAFAQDQTTTDQAAIDHAAATVAHLHDSMLNPPTFVLDGVAVTKPDKKGNINYCYQYRAQNRVGGMAAGTAFEWGRRDKDGSVRTSDSGDGGYEIIHSLECGPKHIDRDITKEVAAAAPALYRKDK